MLKSIFSNKTFHYVTSRYLTLGLQFINAVLLGIYLGPYFLGIWGFIQLIVQYFNQLNLGIPHSMNNIISINKNKKKYIEYAFNTALSMIILLSVFVAILFIANNISEINIGKEYQFNKYAFFVSGIVITNYLNNIFINLYRIHNKLSEIIFSQTITPVLTLVCIVFFKGENLLINLVITNLIAFTVSLLLFFKNSPVKIKPILAKSLFIEIKKRGGLLFVYNSSFYFIIISTRTLISQNFSVEEFGIFTFSFSIASTIMLLLDSLSFIIFPRMIYQFYNSKNEETISLLTDYRSKYVTLAHFMTHLGILCFPLVVFLLPEFAGGLKILSLVAITQVTYSNCFGYPVLLMARKKDKQIAAIALGALIFNIVLGYLFIHIYNFNFSTVILSSASTYFIYNIIIGSFAFKALDIKKSSIELFNSIYPFKLFIPYILGIVLILSTNNLIWYFIIFGIFAILNLSELKKVVDEVKFFLTSVKR